MKKVLLISDNEFLINGFLSILDEKGLFEELEVKISYSYTNKNVDSLKRLGGFPINLSLPEDLSIAKGMDIVFSLHCKQIFPAELVESVKCINIHPGYNPYGRGWYPQVFAILDNTPAGATIHEIDNQLDHGPIIARAQVFIEKSDTSLEVYKKIQSKELELLRENIVEILSSEYSTFKPELSGECKLKSDFSKLCVLDMDHVGTLEEHLDILRALSHGNFDNAYFLDENGRKIYVKIALKVSD